jgi:hypothetical protein
LVVATLLVVHFALRMLLFVQSRAKPFGSQIIRTIFLGTIAVVVYFVFFSPERLFCHVFGLHFLTKISDLSASKESSGDKTVITLAFDETAGDFNDMTTAGFNKILQDVFLAGTSGSAPEWWNPFLGAPDRFYEGKAPDISTTGPNDLLIAYDSKRGRAFARWTGVED